MKDSEGLAEEVRVLRVFRDEFYDYTKIPVAQRWDHPKRALVSISAGPVAAIVERRGRLISVVYGMQGKSEANLGLDWALFTEGREGLPETKVLDHCNLLIGEIQAEMNRAGAREKTLAYKVARLMSFPSKVREELGYDAKSGKGRAATWTVGFFMTCISGLVVAAIVFLLGWNA